ncbi:MAG TPA: hypothetical protein VGM23_03580 [Armatimonadota bacterium]|jgi:hypothetical protein
MQRITLTRNPIFMKHVRARLRGQTLLPMVAIVLLLAGVGVWMCLRVGDPQSQNLSFEEAWLIAVLLLVCLQGFFLFIIGGVMLASSISQARESGMIDFHRASPLTPTELGIGFLFGGPVLEWVLYAATLPAWVVLMFMQSEKILGMLLIVLVTIIAAVCYHLLILLAAMSVPVKQVRTAAALILLVILLYLGWMLPFAAYLTIIPTLNHVLGSPWFREGPYLAIQFFGMTPHPVLPTLLHLGVFIVFLWLAVRRKFRRDEIPPHSKDMTVLFYLCLGVLFLGDLLSLKSPNADSSLQDASPTVILYALFITALLAVAVAQPQLGSFVKGVRLAMKKGLHHLPRWHDFASTTPLTLVLAALLVAIEGAAVWINWSADSSLIRATLATGTAVGAICFMAFMHQFFGLAMRKHVSLYLGLLLFLVWLGPVLIAILGSVSNEDFTLFWRGVLSSSPFAGMGMTLDSDNGTRYGIISCATAWGLALIAAPLAILVERRATARALLPAKAEPAAAAVG